MDGTALLAGVDLYELSAERATNVVYALAAEDGNAWVARGEMRRSLDAALVGARAPVDPTDPSTIAAWGTSREAQQGQDAMIRMMGG